MDPQRNGDLLAWVLFGFCSLAVVFPSRFHFVMAMLGCGFRFISQSSRLAFYFHVDLFVYVLIFRFIYLFALPVFFLFQTCSVFVIDLPSVGKDVLRRASRGH